MGPGNLFGMGGGGGLMGGNPFAMIAQNAMAQSPLAPIYGKMGLMPQGGAPTVSQGPVLMDLMKQMFPEASPDAWAGMRGPGEAPVGPTVEPIQPSKRTLPDISPMPETRETSPKARGLDLEGYIRQSAAARGIDPDIAVKVAMSEGGLKDPFRMGEGPAPRSQKPGLSDREHSFGPFQLYISGNNAGLGDRALAAGIDPRKDWKGGVDFALDEVARVGWDQWYGAKKIGITGKMGVGGRPANAPTARASASTGEPSMADKMQTLQTKTASYTSPAAQQQLAPTSQSGGIETDDAGDVSADEAERLAAESRARRQQQIMALAQASGAELMKRLMASRRQPAMGQEEEMV